MSSKDTTLRRLSKSALIGFAAAGVALFIWSMGWLEVWENKTWDWRSTLMARPSQTTDDIVLILLDQYSLDWASREHEIPWPWPRDLYANVLSYCQRAKAKAVAFDVLFTEPSRYGDELFGDAISDLGRFVGATFLGKKSGQLTAWPKDTPAPAFTLQSESPEYLSTALKQISYPRASMPVPEIRRHAKVLANVHMDPDRDGIYRRIKIINIFDSVVLPALGLGAYLAANPDSDFKFSPRRLMIADHEIPLDRQYQTLLRYRGPSGTHKAYNAAAVIQSEIRILSGEKPTLDPQIFKDKYVFFGFSAPGLLDLRSTPMGGVYTGVEIQATILDNFLSDEFMKPAAAIVTIILVLFLALAASSGLILLVTPSKSILTALVTLGVPVGMAIGAFQVGLWLPLVVMEIAVMLSLVSALVFNYATEGRQKRFIKSAFKQYLNPAVIDQLLKHPERLSLGGEHRTLSIFFSDLQGFTSISEKMSPVELTALLNEYLTAMTEIIHQEGGTVDKYEGDAIIAFWNAPLEVPDHALSVVTAALRCQKKLAEMQPQYLNSIGQAVLMRIGINTGKAVVGNLGSNMRFDYTMIGDAVNLAARLEGVNKQFGIYTLISEATRKLIKDVPAREVAKVAVVGRKEPVRIYEPMYHDQYEARKSVLERFDDGLQLFYQGKFIQALSCFEAVQDLDAPAKAYVAKCRGYLDDPPNDWQGVWVMTQK